VSPTRNIEFKRRSQACEFEELRIKFGSEEVRAWEEYRRIKAGYHTSVVCASQYDGGDYPITERQISTNPSRKLPPGPGWKDKILLEYGANCRYWVSPIRNIEFRRRTQACEFEDLRIKFGCEFRAWEEYRRIKAGSGTYVVSASQYDDDGDHPIPKSSIKTTVATSNEKSSTNPRRKPPPGPGWKDKIVLECGTNCRHWISPKRNIEFRRRTQACEFEELRKKIGCEFRAWEEYRRIKFGHDKYVVSPDQYDTERIGKKPTTPRTKEKNTTTSLTRKKDSLNESKNMNLMESPFNSRPLQTPKDGLNCCEMKIVRIKPSKKPCFFTERFPNRILRIENGLDSDPPQKLVTSRGMKYTLASGKVMQEKKGLRPQFNNEKRIELVYIRTQGLQKELEKICSFSLMKPEKVVARLAHLQSEAQKILYIDMRYIEWIKEEGHEGCGFYPEGFFNDWSRKNYDAMQVRILGPKIGLTKGMLLRKRGITRIQLPESMRKAPPSRTCDERWAAVVIKNVYPSEENNQLGRHLDPEGTPAKSWREKVRKPLSSMYQRMLIGYGVKESDVTTYTKKSRNSHKMRHAHLRGCTDPTGKLPEHKVFISGYISSSDNSRELFGKVHKKVYLSRSPCLEPSDAKLVSVVGTKPKGMDDDDWKLLCSYKFGTIIFPKSTLFDPLPCLIADGDLDGDDYFVLYDEEILNHLLHSKDKLTVKSRKLLHKLELPDGAGLIINKKSKFSKNADNKWLAKAQDNMLDFSTKRAGSQVVGKLWSLCLKSSTRANRKIDLYDEDAISYAKAYKDALDVQKHGGQLVLPRHLHQNLPVSVQELFLTPR